MSKSTSATKKQAREEAREAYEAAMKPARKAYQAVV